MGALTAAASWIWANLTGHREPETALVILLTVFLILLIWRSCLLGFSHNLSEPTSPANVEIRFSQEPPYRWEHRQETHYRIGVFNTSPTASVNVDVLVVDIKPRPRETIFACDLPLPLPPRAGTPGTVRIGPNSEALFEVLRSNIGSDESLYVNGLGQKSSFKMHANELWRIEVRVGTQLHHFVAQPQGSAVFMYREV